MSFSQIIENVQREKITIRIEKQNDYATTIYQGMEFLRKHHKFLFLRDKYFKIENRTFYVPGFFRYKVYEVLGGKGNNLILHRLY